MTLKSTLTKNLQYQTMVCTQNKQDYYVLSLWRHEILSLYFQRKTGKYLDNT